ncbi:MAG: hypothetical protein AB1938_13870 [Myxococcota bacterium]
MTLLSAVFAFAVTQAPMTSTIALKKTADTGTFARYVPFDDGREVVVRRGKELGFHYGLEQGRRKVKVRGGEFELVKFMAVLSPPPLAPGKKPLSPEAAKRYQPVSEVLFLPDAEVAIRREPDGFSEAEVAKILAAISVK